VSQRRDYGNRDFVRDSTQFSLWAIIGGALLLIVVIALSTMAIFGFGLFQRGTADFRGKTQQIEQTKANGSYRIASYEKFFDECAAVQDDEASITSLKEELSGNPKPSDSRIGQINASLTALRASRVEKINHYNADARKTATEGQFRASDLPYQLDKTNEETSCTV
jgi:hypothetical protein